MFKSAGLSIKLCCYLKVILGLLYRDLAAELGFDAKKSDGNWLLTIDGYFFLILHKWQKALLVTLIEICFFTYILLWMDVFIRIYE